MATTFAKLRRDVSDDLEAQVSILQKEVASLRKVLAKRGGQAASDAQDVASDVYDEIASRISDAMPEIRRQSKVVRKAASDNPVAATVIGLALVGLVVGLISRR